MRVKSVLLSFVVTATVVLSPVAIAAPAHAAAVPSSPTSTDISVHPDSSGNVICSDNGIMCVQRITSVDDSGMAKVNVWANTISWKGWFALFRNGNFVRNSPTQPWTAGGKGWVQNLAAGGGWSVRALQNPSSPRQIAEISFGI